VSDDTKKPKDPSANVLVTKPKNASADVSATRPKNPSANLVPSDGYYLEIDGKIKTEYETSDDALKAGLELKKKYPNIQVIVYGAKERTRTLVELSE
jgi:DMSO/TMAO reductase YedYZ molybdopterin-dependent catalytic subunit